MTPRPLPRDVFVQRPPLPRKRQVAWGCVGAICATVLGWVGVIFAVFALVGTLKEWP